jgi:hypothetical protein
MVVDHNFKTQKLMVCAEVLFYSNFINLYSIENVGKRKFTKYGFGQPNHINYNFNFLIRLKSVRLVAQAKTRGDT